MWGGHLWSPSFFMSTVGNMSKETVRKYIQNQLLWFTLVNLDGREDHLSYSYYITLNSICQHLFLELTLKYKHILFH